jgi:CBS domain-containing protein
METGGRMRKKPGRKTRRGPNFGENIRIMNIAFYLTPKMNVVCLRDDWTLRQGLEKMRAHGYTAVPVVTKENRYVGTISEGDFLRYFLDHREELAEAPAFVRKTTVGEVTRPDENPPVKITEDIEHLIGHIIDHNFVPVEDDLGSFIGIVTRKDVIRHLYGGHAGYSVMAGGLRREA